jgi:hypothetical protein
VPVKLAIRKLEYREYDRRAVPKNAGRFSMSKIVDEVITANKKYASSFGAKKDLALPPARAYTSAPTISITRNGRGRTLPNTPPGTLRKKPRGRSNKRRSLKSA